MGILCLIGLVSTGSVAQDRDREFIPLEEISPGMTGFGLTVFEGSRVDTFGVTVIGVQENVRADGSLLLVEVSGHGLEISSIAQGMSGSPIYLDGRFAGALAFGWGGALRPLAGVTPARETLALPTAPAAAQDAEARGLVPDLRSLLPPLKEGEPLAWALSGETGSQPSAAVPTGTWPSAREMILTLLGDLVPEDASALPGPDSWIVQPVGAVAATPTGGPTDPPTDGAFQPGSACAVPLITGDARLGAIGTVTWVDGDRILMMGHPFMQRGPVDWPLATAEVLTVFPSRQMSFKMGSIGRIVGTVHHDQRAGLAGVTGQVPDMIPVTVELAQAGETAGRSFRFEVVDDPGLAPALVFWSLYNSLLAEGDDASRQTLGYRIETFWDGPADLVGEPLVLTGVAAGPGGAMGLASHWMAPLNILLNNSHQPLRLKEVRARLELSRPMATATIVGVTGPRVLPETGGEVFFQVELLPREGARRTLDMTLTLPAHLEAGPYRVLAASAAELFAFEAQRAAGRFQVSSLGGMLDLLRTGRSPDTLVLALMAPGGNLVLQGREMHDLPGSVANLIRSGNMQAPRTLADYVARRELSTEWVLDGFAVRALHLNATAEPIPEERRP